ncbi:MAG: polyprenol monophosphomannose synthase [Candidatus Heimdallarchaeota archaeon]|nr:MAG: polyprenol monophosphomannose synthase [Candidatus Heimdallarchaeota archaeon]
MNISIVIPTYNEKDTLPILIDKLTREVKKIAEKFSIIIMDDSSPDGTGRIAEDLNKKYQNITVIQRPSKLGLGSAYKQGFQIALDRFDPDYVVQMDADHSHDPKEISLMANKIKDHDYVIASRHLPGSTVIGWGVGRKLLHTLAGNFARGCAKLEITDPTSGFRMFKKSVLNAVNFSEIKSEGFAFQVELLCYLRRKGLHGIEIPTRFVNREIGKSKMGLGETIQFTKMCINLLRNRI